MLPPSSLSFLPRCAYVRLPNCLYQTRGDETKYTPNFAARQHRPRQSRSSQPAPMYPLTLSPGLPGGREGGGEVRARQLPAPRAHRSGPGAAQAPPEGEGGAGGAERPDRRAVGQARRSATRHARQGETRKSEGGGDGGRQPASCCCLCEQNPCCRGLGSRLPTANVH